MTSNAINRKCEVHSTCIYWANFTLAFPRKRGAYLHWKLELTRHCTGEEAGRGVGITFLLDVYIHLIYPSRYVSYSLIFILYDAVLQCQSCLFKFFRYALVSKHMAWNKSEMEYIFICCRQYETNVRPKVNTTTR